jgi:hypothetical protein
MKLPKIAVLCAAVTALVVGPTLTAAASDPKDVQMIPPAYTRTSVVNKSKSANYTDKSRQISRCTVQTNNSSCGISRGESATRTIGLALGASRSFVASQLSISSAASVSTTVTCMSPKMKKGQSWVAWGQGDRFTYKIKKETLVSGAVLGSTTSGTVSAFNPKASSITCGVA